MSTSDRPFIILDIFSRGFWERPTLCSPPQVKGYTKVTEARGGERDRERGKRAKKEDFLKKGANNMINHSQS